jgi:hypothetical protein
MPTKPGPIPGKEVPVPLSPTCGPYCSINDCYGKSVGKKTIVWPEASEEVFMDFYLCEKHWKILHKS